MEQNEESASEVRGLIAADHLGHLADSNIIFEVDSEALDPLIKLLSAKAYF